MYIGEALNYVGCKVKFQNILLYSNHEFLFIYIFFVSALKKRVIVSKL